MGKRKRRSKLPRTLPKSESKFRNIQRRLEDAEHTKQWKLVLMYDKQIDAINSAELETKQDDRKPS